MILKIPVSVSVNQHVYTLNSTTIMAWSPLGRETFNGRVQR